MLTPMLEGLRRRLLGKAVRSPEEDRLLRELERIDEDGDLDDATRRLKESERLGPQPGTCPCCGRRD